MCVLINISAYSMYRFVHKYPMCQPAAFRNAKINYGLPCPMSNANKSIQISHTQGVLRLVELGVTYARTAKPLNVPLWRPATTTTTSLPPPIPQPPFPYKSSSPLDADWSSGKFIITFSNFIPKIKLIIILVKSNTHSDNNNKYWNLEVCST